MKIEFNAENCPSLALLVKGNEEGVSILEKLACFYQDFVGSKEKRGRKESKIKPSAYCELLQSLDEEDIIRKREAHLAALLFLLSCLGGGIKPLLSYQEAGKTLSFDETSLGSYLDLTKSYLELENKELRRRGEALRKGKSKESP